MIKGPLQVGEANLTIAEVLRDGIWNWGAISFDLPKEVKERVQATPIQLFGDKEDTLMWKLSWDGDFNIASTYACINSEGDSPQNFKGNWIWKLDIWPKIILFLWLCHHDSISVRQVIANRGINCNPICPICRRHNESINYLLKACPFTTNFWRNMGTPRLCPI